MSTAHILKMKNPSALHGHLISIMPAIEGRDVLIKPNLVVPADPKTGIVTDPEMVKAVIRAAREKGAGKIVVGESPGINVNFDEAITESGLKKAMKEENVEIVNLRDAGMREVDWEFGKIRLPVIAFNSYYINMTRMKTHMNTTVTLGLKNQKGLLTDADKRRFHAEWGLQSPIAQLALLIKPDLTIIDGIIAIEGDGPLYSGMPFEFGIVVVSDDVLAADVTAARAMGFDPEKITHIRIAKDLGIGDFDPEIKGEQLSSVRREFIPADEEKKKIFKLINWRNYHACSMCGESLGMTIHVMMKKPWLLLRYGPKLAYRVLVSGINFISGRHANVPECSGKVVCLGRCTRDIADEYELEWVPGCPPAPEEILKHL
ncbi:MAG: DUF362 domain-containing protein [Chloroflexi bacterium]|nr:DUF362 domain-containing protein [Chloroflexota bacterium]